jgi:hypothetical protein
MLLKLSLVAMAVLSALTLVCNQREVTMDMAKSDKPSSGEVRDGGPDSGFILFTVGLN